MLAYLDANSGSLIASVIAGGAAGIAVVVKMGWRRTLGTLSPKQRRALKQERLHLEESGAGVAAPAAEPTFAVADAAEEA